MTPEKVIFQTHHYQQQLIGFGISPARMDIDRTFASLDTLERLAHAHHLCQGIPEFATDPEQWGKTNRHYASLQTILGFAGRLTLRQMMDDNRS
jgi:hypothetical protein